MNHIKDPTNGNTTGHWAVTVADSTEVYARLCIREKEESAKDHL